MSHQDDAEDRADSLTRRVLNDNQEVRTPDDDLAPPEHTGAPPDAMLSPIPGMTVPAQPQDPDKRATSPVSPIRPSVPDDSHPQPPLVPTLPDDPLPPRPNRALTPREQMQQVEDALIAVREKMSQVAAEFAAGRINRDQFEAIYGRYSEQRDITERLLSRDPESQAWQSVMQSGHTSFLIEHYAARIISYAIYDQASGRLITLSGTMQIDPRQAQAVLARLTQVITERGNPGPAHKEHPDGRCVLIVPGDRTAAIVIYSREPAARQIDRVVDLHADFERANIHALRRRDYAQGRLVFPHRALLDEQS